MPDDKDWSSIYRTKLKSLLVQLITKKIKRASYQDSIIKLHDDFDEELSEYSRFRPFFLAVYAGNILHKRYLKNLDPIFAITSLFGFFSVFSGFLDKVAYHFFKDMPNLGMKEFLAKYLSSDGFNYHKILDNLDYDQYSITEAQLRHVEEHARIHHFAMVNFGIIGLHHGLGFLYEHADDPYDEAFLLGYLPFKGKYDHHRLFSFMARFAVNDLPSSVVGFQDYLSRVVTLSMGNDPFRGMSFFTNSFRILDSPTSLQFLEKVARNFILSRKRTYDLFDDVDCPRNPTEIKSLMRSGAVKYLGFLKRPLIQYHSHYFILHEPSPHNFYSLFQLFKAYLFWDYISTKDFALIRVWDAYLKIDDVLNALPSKVTHIEMEPLHLDLDTPLRHAYKTASFARVPFRHLVIYGSGRSLFPFSLDFIEYRLRSLNLSNITSCRPKDIMIDRVLRSELHFSCPLFSIVFYPPLQTETFFFEFYSPYTIAILDHFLQTIFPYGASLRPTSTIVQIPYSSFSDPRVFSPTLSPYSFRLHHQIDWKNYEEDEKGFVITISETSLYPISIWFTHGYVDEFIRWYNFGHF